MDNTTETNRNYEEIERPYNAFLERSDQTVNQDTINDLSGNSPTTPGSSQSGTNGSVENQPVRSDGAMGDVWIKNFIRSLNWKPKKVGFYIDGQSGYAEFSNVFVSGNIHAFTGEIGGFEIGADYIRDAANNFGLASTVTTGDDVRFWAGTTFADRANAPFKVTEAGVITAESGTIGGNVLTATTISSTFFVSGPLGSGWQVSNTGTAEFQNVIIRGTIRTSVFEKDTISAVNGLVLVSKADVLAADMTALDASVLTISGQTAFAINEVVRLKDGTDDEWMIVTDNALAPIYTVTRDLAGSYGANNNPTWKKGTAVVSMGVGNGASYVFPSTLSVNVSDYIIVPDLPKAGIPSNTSNLPLTIFVADNITTTESINNNPVSGFILLDATSNNSPYIDVYGRNSNTYSDYTIHGRFGWLKGIVDSSVGLNDTNVWGFYTDNAYIKGTIVSTSGTIGGFTIGNDYIKDIADSFGLSSTISGGDDVRFWAGSTFVNRASAPFRVTESGYLVARLSAIANYSPAVGEIPVLDCAVGNDHRIQLPAGNITIAITNVLVGQKFSVSITQDAVGSRTVTWFSTIRWVDSATPTLSSGVSSANKRDTFGFICTGVGTYDGFIVGLYI